MNTDELKTWEALNECECVKKARGNHHETNDLFITSVDYNLRLLNTWVPLLYDPIRPERSLIGIVASIMLKLYPEMSEESAYKETCLIAGKSTRPDLALANVIIEQEGK